MLGIALSWIRGNWETVIIGLAILTLCIYIGVLKYSLGSARGEVAVLNGKLAECQSRFIILTEKINLQNAAIAQIQVESEKKRKAGILALADAKKRAKTLQEKADWLAEQLAKPPNGESCASAFKEWRKQP